MAQALLKKIRVVLVNTTHPGNIGTAARAMKNMGLSSLYVVEPKKPLDADAFSRAGHALDVLDGMVLCKSLDEAIAGCGFVVGTSARERTIAWPLENVREAAQIASAEAQNHEVALVFGREDRGLTNDELQKCHLHLTIPTNEQYSSLNLAQAVQVVAYETRMAALDQPLAVQPTQEDCADAEQMARFFAHLQQMLEAVGYFNPDQPRQTMRRLQRLFNRARLEVAEVQMLRGILKAILRGKL